MAKKTFKKEGLSYTAISEPDKEAGYPGTIPSLPACISEGDTFKEALKNIQSR